MTTTLKDMTGQTYGRLTVIERAENDAAKRARWRCRCSCGTEVVCGGKNLRTGNTRSCGCLQVEETIARSTKHGAARSRSRDPVYCVWKTLVQRCTNPKCKDFPLYGGREVTMAPEFTDFVAFRAAAGPRPEGRPYEWTIDRIDNERGYEPGNLRWATQKEQANNRRSRWRAR